MFVYIASQIPNEFHLVVKKDRKLDTIKLSSEFRNDILTAILKHYKEFSDKPKQLQVRRILIRVVLLMLSDKILPGAN